jgi:hypothetical protein
MSGRQFEVVQPSPLPPQHQMPAPTVPPDSKIARDAAHMLALALGALSQKALVAVSTLFTLMGVGLTWWLWNAVLPDPKPLQLIGLGEWALFLLVVEWVRRR